MNGITFPVCPPGVVVVGDGGPRIEARGWNLNGTPFSMVTHGALGDGGLDDKSPADEWHHGSVCTFCRK